MAAAPYTLGRHGRHFLFSVPERSGDLTAVRENRTEMALDLIVGGLIVQSIHRNSESLRNES